MQFAVKSSVLPGFVVHPNVYKGVTRENKWGCITTDARIMIIKCPNIYSGLG